MGGFECERGKGQGRGRCGEIDSLASQQFNTTELLLHSSPYEMRSLSPAPLSFVTLYMCVSACVYQYMCDPLMTGSILYNLDFRVRRSVSLFLCVCSSVCLFDISLSLVLHFSVCEV